jgi:hypothetical protein
MKSMKLVLGMALAALSCEGLSASTPNAIYTYIQTRYCGKTPPPHALVTGLAAVAGDVAFVDPVSAGPQDAVSAEFASKVADFHAALAQEKATTAQVTAAPVAHETPAFDAPVRSDLEKAARKEAARRRAERDAAIRKDAQDRKKKVLARNEKE